MKIVKSLKSKLNNSVKNTNTPIKLEKFEFSYKI